MSKFTLISHYDLDGVVSDIVLSKVVPIGYKMYGGYHRFDGFIEKVKKGENVIIADCCFNINQFAMLKQKANKVIYIDHHPESKEIKETFVNDVVIFDQSKAGAGLCLDFVQKRKEMTKQIKLLAKAANHYDLYDREEEPNWFKFGYDLNILFWEYHYKKFFERFENGFDAFTKLELNILKRAKAKTERAIADSTYVELEGDPKGLFCVPAENGIQNDIPYHVKGFDVYYVLMSWPKSTSISVRTSKIDLTKYMPVAEMYPDVQGAGGHPQAAGINFKGKPSDDVIVRVLNDIHAAIVKGENFSK